MSAGAAREGGPPPSGEVVFEPRLKPARLHRLLNRLGLTNAEVGAALGVHERTVYKWLSGERPVPKTTYMALELLLRVKPQK